MGGPLRFGKTPSPSEEVINNVQKELDDWSQKSTNSILLKLFPNRSEIVSCLRIVAEGNKYSEKQRIVSMQVLGLLHERQYSYILVENLLLGYEGPIESDKLTESNFPIGFALINMGSSYQMRLKLLSAIKNSYKNEKIKLCAFILMKIEDKDVAKFILNRELQREKDERIKSNLEKALSFFE